MNRRAHLLLFSLLFFPFSSYALVYEVVPHTPIKHVARDLKKLGIIRCAFCFEWRLRWEGKPILAGEYEFSEGMSTHELMRSLIHGQVIHYPITFVEGWRLDQVFSEVAGLSKIRRSLETPEALALALDIKQENPEGWLFPNTYDYTKGSLDRTVYYQAYQLMQVSLEQAWKNRDPELILKTPYELLIMASIIEKEAGLVSEMPLISGVYHRRLQRGMRLQADPTVIYGLGKAFQGRLRKKDLLKDTPYNTYTRGGLPPTPIALPGLAALEAAAHPLPGDAYYFVAKGDGTHHFSNNLESHQKAVKQYQ